MAQHINKSSMRPLTSDVCNSSCIRIQCELNTHCELIYVDI